GAGQHGVATATAYALFGLPCEIYMGAVDVERQALNVFRMRLLGAQVHAVKDGTATLKDAMNEALRDWVTNVRDTHYVIGSVVGAHPSPTLARDSQATIAPGLDYPGVGPEHSYLRAPGRARYLAVTDSEALTAFQQLARTEGILPALESSHAIAALPRVASELEDGAVLLVSLSGRGDKDMGTVAKALGVELPR